MHSVPLDPESSAHCCLTRRDLREDVNIFVAGKNIASLQGIQTMLADGDEVALFPAAIGG